MTLVHKVTGENAFFIKENKTQLAQEQLVLRLQELGLSLENAKLIVEYGVLSYEGITTIMLGNSILAPEDKRIKIAYDALYHAQNIEKNNEKNNKLIQKYNKAMQDMREYIGCFSKRIVFKVVNMEDVLSQAEKNKQIELYGILLSPLDALIMAVHDYLMCRQGEIELEQRFSVQHETQTIEIEEVQLEMKAPSSISRQGKTRKSHKAVSIKEAAQILGCGLTTIKRYDKGEGELAEHYPGRDSVTALRQFAARRSTHKATQRTAKEMRNAQTGYNLDEL